MLVFHSGGIPYPTTQTGVAKAGDTALAYKAFRCLESCGTNVHYFAKSRVLPASKSFLASTDKQDFQNQKVSQEAIMVQSWVLNSNSITLLVREEKKRLAERLPNSIH